MASAVPVTANKVNAQHSSSACPILLAVSTAALLFFLFALTMSAQTQSYSAPSSDGGGSGTVNTGTAGQLAQYLTTGTTVGGYTPIESDITNWLGFTPLNPANNLSDLASPSAARINLGLGSAATQSTSAFDASGAATAAVSALGTFIPATSKLLAGSGTANLSADSLVGILYSAANSNLLLGVGFSTTLTGTADTVFGINAGSSLTLPGSSATPQNNTFIGYRAGQSATTARESTIIGANAGQSIIGNGLGVEDCIDTFIGSYAGASELCTTPASEDGYDVYVGQKAGLNSTHGLNNVFVGVHTGTSCWGSDCRDDVIIGQAAMNGAISGSPGIPLTQSVVIGVGAFNGSTAGGNNVGNNFIGFLAGSSAYNVSDSNCFGRAACNALASASSVTAFGDEAGEKLTASNASLFGSGAGSRATTAADLSLFGHNSGINVTTGSDISCFGYNSCTYLATAAGASVFGSGAGQIMTGTNDLFGYSAGAAITTGQNNVAFGSQSLHALVSSRANTAVGYQSAHGTTAQGSTDIGYEAGYNATTGAENTLVGEMAGFGITTGSQNVIVGADHAPSNPLTTGNNNQMLGWGAFVGPAVSGAVQIGQGTNSASNTMQYQNINVLTNTGVGTLPSVVGVSVTAEVVPTPSYPAITTAGTAGTTTDTYQLVGRAVSSSGFYSAASATASIATANATLNGTNYNVITFPAPAAGISCYDVYRTAAGGTPSTTGKIASCQTVSYNDQGAAGDGTRAPTSATGGYLYDAVYTVGALPSTCTAGQKANVSDASSPAYLGTLTGGGSTFTPVVCKGSNTWISY